MKFNLETAISCMVGALVALIVFDMLIQPMLEKMAPGNYEEYEEE